MLMPSYIAESNPFPVASVAPGVQPVGGGRFGHSLRSAPVTLAAWFAAARSASSRLSGRGLAGAVETFRMVLPRIRRSVCLARHHRETALSDPCSGAESPGLREISHSAPQQRPTRSTSKRAWPCGRDSNRGISRQSCDEICRPKSADDRIHTNEVRSSSEDARRSVTAESRRVIDDSSSPNELNATPHGNRFSLTIDGNVSEKSMGDPDLFSAPGRRCVHPDFDRDRHLKCDQFSRTQA